MEDRKHQAGVAGHARAKSSDKSPAAPRSLLCGRVACWKKAVAAFILVVACTAGGAWCWQAYQWHRVNFHVVEPGRLYRAGLGSKSALERILYKYPVHTIITLTCDVSPRLHELEQFMDGRKDITHIKMPRAVTVVPTVEDTCRVLSIFADSNNWPVLIHCEHGKDRTGCFVIMHRVIDDGWPFEKALHEAYSCGMNPSGRIQRVVRELPGVIDAATNRMHRTLSSHPGTQ